MKARRVRKSAYLRGAGSVLDLRGRSAVTGRYIKSRNPDAAALSADWAAVGRDLQVGITRAQAEIKRRG